MSTNHVKARTEVAVGVLVQADGQILMTTRPTGKAYAAYWEFPGGKLEAGETVAQALQRELMEELGITIDITPASTQIWRVSEHDYEHALVRLNWCIVRAWAGELQMREGQQAAWQRFPLTLHPILPGAFAVLDDLAIQIA